MTTKGGTKARKYSHRVWLDRYQRAIMRLNTKYGDRLEPVDRARLLRDLAERTLTEPRHSGEPNILECLLR